jgi:hypothetical protein
VKHVAKSFMNGPYVKASLQRLKTRITELQTVIEGALRLAPFRSQVSDANVLKNLERVQECAAGLYNALQAGWRCNCERLHPANMKLDNWSSRATENADEDHFNFTFLFADDAQHAHHEHWMTAEYVPSSRTSSDSQGARPLSLSSLGGPLAGTFR